MIEQSAARRSPVRPRTGYVAGGVANAVLLWLLHVWPGWHVVPFLTGDMTHVLGWIDASLVAGIVVSLAHLVRDPGWLTPAGTLVTTAVGLAATARMLQVFPFALSAGWSTVVRILLVVGVVASVVGLVVALVSLARIVRAERA